MPLTGWAAGGGGHVPWAQRLNIRAGSELLLNHVNLGELLHVSGPQFPHMSNEHDRPALDSPEKWSR